MVGQEALAQSSELGELLQRAHLGTGLKVVHQACETYFQTCPKQVLGEGWNRQLGEHQHQHHQHQDRPQAVPNLRPRLGAGKKAV
jgi:hypothetical protein